ncbi:MAG: hypothetical protein A3I12_06345 [Gammaproteobacteria bacterium RIFCSPLOWO2_02_FULL_38_11]|nr:MAG: hypothetical protein A3I12_06345 [Gammaproteobacteria bacterium RIFCSPLOWO2_02_FULL_38_11]OGT76507.1 MAG: hypothetical protein A3G71_07255 [Gammaproteobacteria bacterium RIFCSPLOWO2_12_FULL_38_14]
MKSTSLKLTHGLKRLAERYVWWNSTEWACQHAPLFLSHVMNAGAWEDIQSLRQEVNDALLKKILLQAPPGIFTYRSWDYWHVKLGISPIPPLPKRKF